MINEQCAHKYCKEDISKIKNYEQAVNDTIQVWECHHMTETWWNCSKKDKTTSVFGAAYKEHYGITKGDNVKLYHKEYSYYNRHGHFSWEN